MKYFPELIRTNIPFILLLFFGVVAFGAAWWIYRRPLPEISDTKKYLLAGLRFLVVFLVIFLFARPRLLLTFQELQKEKIGIFVDNSLSMTLQDDSTKRWDQVKKLIRQLKKMTGKGREVSWFAFNSDCKALNPDRIALSQGGTNFSKMLAFVQEKAFDKALIISDGNYTEGSYPLARAWRADAKLYTIGVGKKKADADLFISDVQFQAITYQDKKTTFKVEVGSRNLAKKTKVRLRLLHKNKILSQHLLSLGGQDALKNIVLSYKPLKTGLYKLRFVLEPLKDENNIQNNRRSLVQDVLKSKIRVAVLSGQPDYEGKFIRLLLRQNSDFEVRLLAQDNQGRFIGRYAKIAWGSLDVLVFQDFPGTYTHPKIMQVLQPLLKTGRLGALFFLNRRPDFGLLKAWQPFLPFKKMPRLLPRPINGLGYNTPKNTLLNLFDDFILNERYWQKIPPLNFYFTIPLLKKGARTLLSARTVSGDFPLLIARRYRGKRFFTFLGQGFWKWHFLLQDEPDLQTGYQTLLTRLIRQTASKSGLKRVELQAEVRSTHPGQAVKLQGYLYDADFKALPHGEMVIRARWKGQQFDLPLRSDSLSGRFEARFIPPGTGRFELTASGYRNGTLLGRDSLTLEVLPFEKEFLQSGQNVPFLKKLAARGNGFYISSQGLDSLTSVLKAGGSFEKKEKDIALWYQSWLLILIISLVSIEWILRKVWRLV